MEALSELNPVMQAFVATLFTWGVTALGALPVFFMKTMNQKLLDGMLGMAAGVMIAASYWSLVAPGNVNGVEFFLVIIRVRKATTTYLGAYLPAPVERSEEFFELMEQCSREHDGETFTIPMKDLFT